MYYRLLTGRSRVRVNTSFLRTVLVNSLAVLGCLCQSLGATPMVVSAADLDRQACSAPSSGQAEPKSTIGFFPQSPRAIPCESRLEATRVKKAVVLLDKGEVVRLAPHF
jgi:hypothetical protein